MKKIFIISVLTLSLYGCGEPAEPVADFTNLYSQVCETKDGPCFKMTCNLKEETYRCAESISKIGKDCGEIKSMDSVMEKYQICGLENSEKYKIFNYAQNIEALSHAETPAELEKKIKEETAIVESGGSSSFLNMFMASMGGAIVGGLISNALFNRPMAMPPKTPASGYSQPFKKEDLNKAKSAVESNSSKVKKSVTSTKKKSLKKSKIGKKSTIRKKAKKRRSFGRRRR